VRLKVGALDEWLVHAGGGVAAVASTIRTDGATVAAEVLLDAGSREKAPGHSTTPD
jgi:hypothetical protein